MSSGRHAAPSAARQQAQRSKRTRIISAAIIIVLIAALVLVGVFVRPLITGSTGKQANNSASSTTSASKSATQHKQKTKQQANTDTTDASSQDAEATSPVDLGQQRVDAVRQTVESTIASYPGTWSVYIADLESGKEATIGDSQPLVAASLIKLYIMLAVFDGIEQGTITDTATIDADLTQMITVSSNDAANRLLAVIGGTQGTAQAIATVTDTAQRYGFTGTQELRALTGMASGNTVENWTSSLDCGRFLMKAYNGELVSQNASKRMTDLLLGQTRRSKIPAGVPAGIQVANKTGELAAVQNDVAIVYGTHPYVLAVMANNVDGSAVTRISSLSAAVYQAFEQ